jgi:hypothetical protein
MAVGYWVMANGKKKEEIKIRVLGVGYDPSVVPGVGAIRGDRNVEN